MPEKRKRHEADKGDHRVKKQKRKGFSVGPANLPDGTHKRKGKRLENGNVR